MIESLHAQRARGVVAAQDLRDAGAMLAHIATWDVLTSAEKSAQYGLGPKSPYSEVPGFEPVACADCSVDVFPDYRADPEGACPVNPDHTLWSHGWSDRAAA